MSRIGKHPIEIPAGVNVVLKDNVISAKGKNGEFSFTVCNDVSVEIADGKIIFKPANDTKAARAMWGTSRAIVAKGIAGLDQLFVKKVNYRGTEHCMH